MQQTKYINFNSAWKKKKNPAYVSIAFRFKREWVTLKEGCVLNCAHQPHTVETEILMTEPIPKEFYLFTMFNLKIFLEVIFYSTKRRRPF